MSKKLAKTIFATTSILVGAALSTASPSQADTVNAHLISYSPSQFTQVGANAAGTAYEVKGLMQMTVGLKLVADAEKVGKVKSWLASVEIRTEDTGWDVLKYIQKYYPVTKRKNKIIEMISVDIKHMYSAVTSDVSDSFGLRMVEYCNNMADKLRGQGKSNAEIFSIDRTVQVAIDPILSAQFSLDGPDIPIQADEKEEHPESFSDLNKINLICKGAQTPPVQTAGAFKPPPVDFKINDIDLFLSTYSNANTTSNHAIVASCKKGQIKVRLKASKAGPAKFKLWTQLGAAPMTSKEVEAEASWDGEGFKAEYVEWVSVDETTNLKAKAEEMVDLGLNTPWKEIKLLCSGSGATISQDTSDYEAKAVIALYDANNKDSRCPRTGHAGFTFSSNYSKPINYRLTSNTGIDKSGIVELSKSGSEWKGLVMVPFPVDKTMGMGVVLRHIQNGVATIVATKTRDYKCKAPITVDTGSNDLKVPTRPDPNAPKADWQGAVTVADSSGPNTCPRQGQVFFEVKRPQAGDFKYRMGCSNGASFSGTKTAVSTGGLYKAFGAHTLNITKARNIQCTLQEVKPNGARVTIAKSDHRFTCRSQTTHTGAGNLVHGTNPSSSTPELPQKLVVGTGTQNGPSAPWQCVDGTVRGHNGCVCPPHKKLIYTQIVDHGISHSGSKCVLSGPGDKTTKPDSSSTDDANQRLQAAAVAKRMRQAAIAKHKAAAAKALKLKAVKAAAIAKRKRNAVIKAAAAVRIRQQRALRAAAANRAAAAALARRRTAATRGIRRNPTLRNRAVQSPTSTGTTTRRRGLRRR